MKDKDRPQASNDWHGGFSLGFIAGQTLTPTSATEKYILALKNVSEMNAKNLDTIAKLNEVIARQAVQIEQLKKPLEERKTEK